MLTFGIACPGGRNGSLCADEAANCSPCPAAACGSYNYTSPVTESTYYLNNCNNATFDPAEEICNSLGGHLVSYTMADEQQDVESYFFTLGGAQPASGVAAAQLNGWAALYTSCLAA
jgi:hypothetical protein